MLSVTFLWKDKVKTCRNSQEAKNKVAFDLVCPTMPLLLNPESFLKE